MSETVDTLLPTPVRATVTDDPYDILCFAAKEGAKGAALATLVEIRGGAARALGSHMAITADGRFCGYVSGGCVEAAVATEALLAMSEGRDRIVKFGEGSSFFDIVLPCGGGITVAIHVLRDTTVLQRAIAQLKKRSNVALEYCPSNQTLSIMDKLPVRSMWAEARFLALHRPRIRLVVSGQTAEAQAVLTLGKASGFEIRTFDHLNAGNDQENLIDPMSAVILLHHDLDAERDILEQAICSEAFYIGALGSTRTHKRRTDRLNAAGMPREAIDRIKAPIGMFGPARDTVSLALSVLADVAAARLVAYP